jgi:hypothetical protein
VRRWAVLGVLVAGPGCSGAPCVEVPAECTPQYEPTFDAVWSNTLSTSCALSGCHGGATGSGGLAMGASADEAYEALRAGYVEPGEPGCSLVVDHLEPAGLGDMPPGATLSEEERCAVRSWIADGASR